MVNTAAAPGRFGAAFDWLGIEQAWRRTRGEPTVIVAIIDEGVQLDHPLLGPNIQRDSAHQMMMSDDSYAIAGTQAAGVIAGRRSEVEQFSGVAPGARLLPVRCSQRAGTQALDMAHAIEHAVQMGASILHVAAAAQLHSAAARRAVQYAATRNVLVVCGASSSLPLSSIDEDMPNLLSVLALDEARQAIDSDTAAHAHLAAPGFARVPEWGARGHVPGSDAALGAAYVSGCAALLKSQNPGWGYLEIKEHLISSAQPEAALADRCAYPVILDIGSAVLGPLEHAAPAAALTWSSLADAQLRWKLRYRAALCVNTVALYRPHGSEHWRELAYARAGAEHMVIPASALRRSSGTLRLGCRGANFHADDLSLTIL